MSSFADACVIVALLGAIGCDAGPPIECTPDETMCHGSCSALFKDPDNCGACDAACPSPLVCSAGHCATVCGPGTIQCGQSCVDPKNDRANCGGCDVACGTKVCVEGECTSACPSFQSTCAGSDGAYCATTASDNANCGGCGVACAGGQSCALGECRSVCGDNETVCDPSSAISHCADLMTSPFDCGACGWICTLGAECHSGVCECPVGQTACGAGCVDLQTDLANCGSCSAACAGTCGGGRCTTVIASAANATTIAADLYNVYWIDAGGLEQAPLGGGTTITLATSISATSLAADDDGWNVYWPDGENVDFVPIDGGAISYQSIGASVIAEDVVTDSTNVYVAVSDGIVAFPCGGGTVTRIVSNEPLAHDLQKYSSYLYWVTSDNRIRRVKTDGTGLTTVVSMSSAIGPIVAGNADAAYTWNDGLLSVANDGSGSPSVLAGGLSNVAALAISSTRVYWLDANGISSVFITGGSAPTHFTSISGADLAVTNKSVYWTSSSTVFALTPKY